MPRLSNCEHCHFAEHPTLTRPHSSPNAPVMIDSDVAQIVAGAMVAFDLCWRLGRVWPRVACAPTPQKVREFRRGSVHDGSGAEGLGNRERNGHRDALSQHAARIDRAMVALDNLAAGGQANACAFVFHAAV